MQEHLNATGVVMGECATMPEPTPVLKGHIEMLSGILDRLTRVTNRVGSAQDKIFGAEPTPDGTKEAAASYGYCDSFNRAVATIHDRMELLESHASRLDSL